VILRRDAIRRARLCHDKSYVRPSVSDVKVRLSHFWLEYLENNCTVSCAIVFLRGHSLVTCSDNFAVGCRPYRLYPQCTSSPTQTDEIMMPLAYHIAFSMIG